MKYMSDYINSLTTAKLEDKATLENMNTIIFPAVVSERKIIERVMKSLPFNSSERKKLSNSRDYINSQLRAYENRLRRL